MNVLRLLNNVCNDEQGAALAEYALLVGLIAIVCITVITQLGFTISGSLSTSCTALNGTGC
jgi:Flp pilus assembly pilin Flp